MSELEKARLAVMAEVGYARQTGKNAHQGYSYASEADLLRALRPAMVAHGLTLTPVCIGPLTLHEVAGRNSVQRVVTATVRYRLAHVSTEFVEIEVLASGADNLDKGAFKLMTGAEKYALRQAFLIETGDDPERENERDEPAPAPRKRRASPAAPQAETAPGLSEEEMNDIGAKLEACDSKAELRECWGVNAIGWKEIATPAQWGEIENYKNMRKEALNA